jgi:hypothetical protein
MSITENSLCKVMSLALLSESEVEAMSESGAVEQPPATPITVAPIEKRKREISGIEFPYGSLDDAIEIAKAVHKLGGNECRLELLAADLGHETVKSGGFRQKVSTAHIFGLTSLSQGIVSLSALGTRIIDEEHEKAARVEAFLTVPLYKAIFDEFKTGLLPPPSGLETKMVTLGVSPKQKDKARQVFQRSAKEAGFFAYGTTKLVYPALSNGTPKGKDKDEEKPLLEPPNNGGNGGNGGGVKRHPFIEGLLETLPMAALGTPKVEWSLQDRREWLQTAAGIFNLIYKSNEEDAATRALVVSFIPLPPSSAK